MTSRDVTALTDVAKFKTEADGSFKRQVSIFRDTISVGGKYEPAPGRYVLYVSYACRFPSAWAHRTIIVRHLKGLTDFIQMIVVSPHLGPDGWPFASADPFPGADVDDVNNGKHIKDVYLKADPDYSQRFTVPVLWDKQTSTIVNNESAEIIRILNTGFNHILPPKYAKVDLYPTPLQGEIDSVNDWIYDTISNGVYKAGIATTQEAYEKAFDNLFQALDQLEVQLQDKDFLVGDQLTEADVRLYPTIVRFDPVYFFLFKCNLRNIREGYPNIHRWLRNLYWKNDSFKSTTNFDHIKTHYWWSLVQINPSRVVPVGPKLHILPL